MGSKPTDENYSAEEAGRRLEAALRGARLAAPHPMKDVPKRRPESKRKAPKPSS